MGSQSHGRGWLLAGVLLAGCSPSSSTGSGVLNDSGADVDGEAPSDAGEDVTIDAPSAYDVTAQDAPGDGATVDGAPEAATEAGADSSIPSEGGADTGGSLDAAPSCVGPSCVWQQEIEQPNGIGSLAQDPSGNIIFTASGGGTTPVVLEKLTSAGATVWTEQFANADDNPGIVAVDASGNIYVAGSFVYSLTICGGMSGGGPSGPEIGYVVKLNPDGSCAWRVLSAGSGGLTVNAIALDSLGQPVVVGGVGAPSATFDGMTFNSNSSVAVVAKLSASGSLLWSHSYEDPIIPDAGGSPLPEPEVGAYAVAIDSSDNVVFSGDYAGTVDFGGGQLPPARVSPFDNAFITKLDASGAYVWSKAFVPTESSFPADASAGVSALAIDAAGDIAFSGNFQTSIDLGAGPLSCGTDVAVGEMLGELDATGSLLWDRALCASSGTAFASSLGFVGSNLYAAGGILGGSFDPACGAIAVTNSSWPAGFAAEYGASGTPIWSAGFGLGESTLSVAPSSIVLAGYLFGSLNYGCGTLTDDAGGQPPNAIRGYVVKLTP